MRGTLSLHRPVKDEGRHTPGMSERPEIIARRIAYDTNLDSSQSAQLQRVASALWSARNCWAIEKARKAARHG